MKKLFHHYGPVVSLVFILVGIGLVMAGQSVTPLVNNQKTTIRFTDNRVIVALKGSDNQKADEIKKLTGATTLTPLGSSDQGVSFYQFDYPKDISSDEALSKTQALPQVVSAQKEGIATILKTPNDPFFSCCVVQQNNQFMWNLRQIQAEQAWEVTTGSPDLLVGVIDTGIAPNHEDLKANTWTNPGEIASNGIDDDGNGYRDDVHGYDFYNNDGDPSDDNNHGTKSSGVIGAVGNNGLGLAGIVWNVKIVGCKAFAPNGSGSYSAIYACMNYFNVLKQRGYNVVATSNSYGGGSSDTLINDAINKANSLGIVVVASAGNSSINNDTFPQYPASYPQSNVIAVAATNQNDDRIGYSNYGPTSVDISAPSDYIATTIPAGYNAVYNGTSAAAPHVAGAVALVKSAKPALTGLQVKDQILTAGDKKPQLNGLWTCGCRLNLATAVSNPGQAPDTLPPSVPLGLTATLAPKSTVQLNWQASTDNVGVAGYNIYRDGAKISSSVALSFVDLGASLGTHSYTVTAYDAAGNESAKSTPAVITVTDNTAPTAPTNLTGSSNQSTVTVSWSAATDDVAVTGYDIFRTAVKVGTVGGNVVSFTETNVPFGTQTYTVKAFDAAGNISTASNALNLTVSDTQAPSAPTNLSGTVSGSTITLTWDAATDNVGVKDYQVLRDGNQITTVTTTTYADQNLAVGSYVYIVKATDAAGNISLPSNQAKVGIGDTQAPSIPTKVKSNVTDVTAQLSWDASTDNVGVTGYAIYRDAVKVGTTTNLTYSEDKLAPAIYTYSITAFDAVGNESAKSSTVTATIDARTACFDQLKLINRDAGKQRHTNLTVTLSTKNGTLIGSTKTNSSDSGRITIKEGFLNSLDTNPSTPYSLWIKGIDYLAVRQDVSGFLSGCSTLTKSMRLGDLAGNNNKIDLADLIELIKRIQGKSELGEGFYGKTKITLITLTNLLKDYKTNPNGDE